MPATPPSLSRRVLTAGAGFLLAVLWLDLMLDVQKLGQDGAVLPEPVMASIAAYYQRVTTAAFPMNRLIAVVMLFTVAAALVQLLRRNVGRGLGWTTLVLALLPIGLAAARVVPNAVRLGTRADDLVTQSALARAICHDHLFCVGCIAALLVLQLLPARR